MAVNLQNKNVIVTGAAGGIGRELVRILLEKGARVIATDYDKSVLENIQAPPGNQGELVLQKLDVANAKDWDKAVDAAREKGLLDVVINNAGVLRTGFIKDFAIEDIDFHFNVNVKGLIIGSKKAAETMLRQNSGHIVNVASLAGVAPIPGLSLYSASKFAARSFTLALASELRRSEVKATVVCPDAVQTPMLDIQKDKTEAALTFSGSVLTATEIAEVIVGAIGSNETEILHPWGRGMLAKIANAAPAISRMMMDRLEEAGLKKQNEL